MNRTGRSVNIIQHKKLAFRRQTFIEPLLYTAMAAPNTLLGVVKIGYIFLQIGEKYKFTLLSFTCGYIKLEKI